MKNSLEVTFPNLARIKEYCKNKNWRNPQEMIRHAVTQYMRQYKDTREEQNKVIAMVVKEVELLRHEVAALKRNND